MTKKTAVKRTKKPAHKSGVKTKKTVTKKPVVKPKVSPVEAKLAEMAAKVAKLQALLEAQAEPVTAKVAAPPSEEPTVTMSELFRFFDIVDGVRKAYISKYMFAACEQEFKRHFNGEIKVPARPRSMFGGTFKRSVPKAPVAAPVASASVPVLVETVVSTEPTPPTVSTYCKEILEMGGVPTATIETTPVSEATPPQKVEYLKEVVRLLNNSDKQ
jgi:hypothetical protein